MSKEEAYIEKFEDQEKAFHDEQTNVELDEQDDSPIEEVRVTVPSTYSNVAIVVVLQFLEPCLISLRALLAPSQTLMIPSCPTTPSVCGPWD